mmetsp:Transcript_7834/g.11447  ORF Transcript_7834/g.11447 Transcript_7834/m.11447 type:complete len:487 (+) Transcript_7834:82-1542(+)|eukprot:CAMPEP_0195510778 /NCGR_PEP_ID=MMETSP0794_2-20130614/3324_1 /TAXON_ID=515487 /ORGANISM="Stephanopyxis turris, Strain CCMP 815" /LENGTH=486 /DNA_ID=CAMNT_0040638265 /DNA_START=63 /DNA_END=1523 /DNA_ORIENTATION=+
MVKENTGRGRASRNAKHVCMYLLLAFFIVILPLILFLKKVWLLSLSGVRKKNYEFASVSSHKTSKALESPIKSSFVGYATPMSTTEFYFDATSQHLGKAAGVLAHKDSFREAPTGQILSTIGMGTYIGDKDDRTDNLVADAIVQSVNAGVNVIDSASNYRGGKGEISVGMALRRLFSNEESNAIDDEPTTPRRRFSRSEIFISTKAGFVSSKELFKRAMKKGANKADFGGGGKHCIAPACLEASLDISLERMGIQTVDLFYLHNVAEKRDSEVASQAELLDMIQRAFVHLEKERDLGRIRYYGLATFSKSFRLPPGQPGALDVFDVVNVARKAKGCDILPSAFVAKNDPNEDVLTCDHGFRYIQLPVSPASFPEMYTKSWQSKGFETLADAASRYKVGLFSSKSLGREPPKCLDLSTRGTSLALMSKNEKARILDITRSSPGLLSALVGHKTPAHVRANLDVMAISPLTTNEFNAKVAKCQTKGAV